LTLVLRQTKPTQLPQNKRFRVALKYTISEGEYLSDSNFESITILAKDIMKFARLHPIHSLTPLTNETYYT
jgi:hypothetical protein